MLDLSKADKTFLVEGWRYHRSRPPLHFNGCCGKEKLAGEELIASLHMRMPAIKKERVDGEMITRGLLDGLPEYLPPLTIPVVRPHHPTPYEHIFTRRQRAFLGLPEPAHPSDLLLERFHSIPDFQPIFDNGEPCIEVECGENKALLYVHKLCQGSKGPSIRYRGEWLTPNEFQFVSGRETAKDWKRSIRHKGGCSETDREGERSIRLAIRGREKCGYSTLGDSSRLEQLKNVRKSCSNCTHYGYTGSIDC